MAIVTTDNKHYTNIASAIREKTGTATEYKPEEMATGVGEAYEAGQQAEYDRFWDALQQNGNKTNYDCLFYYDHWTDETYNPKHPIRCENNTNAGRQVFSGSWQITDIKVPIYAKNTRLVYTFQNCNRLKTIPLLYVEGVTDFNSCFANCDVLENITMAGAVNKSIGFAQSKLLTEQSVQSVIDVLADLTGQTAQTLTFHATVGEKLTQAQKATVTAKNWTLVY